VSKTAIKFTLRVCLHERVPSVGSLSNGIGLPIPALAIQMSSPPYVETCFSNAAARSPVSGFELIHLYNKLTSAFDDLRNPCLLYITLLHDSWRLKGVEG